MAPDANTLMARMDTNHDGKISIMEWDVYFRCGTAPSLLVVGVSIGMERGCQHKDSLHSTFSRCFNRHGEGVSAK